MNFGCKIGHAMVPLLFVPVNSFKATDDCAINP